MDDRSPYLVLLLDEFVVLQGYLQVRKLVPLSPHFPGRESPISYARIQPGTAQVGAFSLYTTPSISAGEREFGCAVDNILKMDISNG